jgi:hypothetical protein
MKTNDLRHTALILAGILLATFVGSGWWISRQAVALREITQSLQQTRDAHENEKQQLAITLKKHENARAEIKVIQAQQDQMKRTPSQYPIGVLHLAKRGFNDIQAHVAKGEFKGLALTDGYMELKQIFDNPAFEDMLANDHGAQRAQE